MNPRDFQILASELVKDGRASAYRTAISRAYYAVHNVGVEILTEFGFTINKNPSGHSDVWNRFSNSGDSELENVGSQLCNLHGQSISADYRMGKKDIENPKTVQVTIENANKMIQIIDETCSSQKRTRIITAIKEWEKKTNP
jgi:hypothetical protein